MKIAVLTPRHSLPMIQEVLQKNGILSQFGLVVYDSLTQLPDQYDGVKDKAQGILVTGKLPWRFLMAKRPNLELPVTCIAHSRLRSCLYLLRHLIDHPDIPLGETFCDFIHEIGDYATYADLLPPGQLPYTMFITGATERLIEETAGHVEELYRQKKIKMAYLTITQLYISLSERGVPCQHIGIQPEDILQAAQEALRRGSLERRDSLRDEAALGTWFTRILVNACMDLLRQRKRVTFVSPEDLDTGSYEDPLPEDGALGRRGNALPPEVQTVVKLRFYEDMSLKEISEVTGWNLNTVKSRLYAGLKKLRISLEGVSMQ